MLWKRCFQVLTIAVAGGLLLDLTSRLGVEVLWFQEVHYLRDFLLRLQVRFVLWGVVALGSVVYLLGNLALAQRLSRTAAEGILQDLRKNERLSASVVPPPFMALKLQTLLPMVLGLGGLAGWIVMRYVHLAVYYWRNGPTLIPPLMTQLYGQHGQNLWLTGSTALQVDLRGWAILSFVILLLLMPGVCLRVSTVGFSLLLGWLFSKQWAVVLKYFHATAFHSTDPLFGKDIGFYIFALPLWELLELWLVALSLFGFLAVALSYLLANESLSEGYFPGFSAVQQRHLCGVGGVVMLTLALSAWLGRYALLYSTQGVTFGASYTDVIAQLPLLGALSFVALAIAGYLLGWAILWPAKWRYCRGFNLLLGGSYGLLLCAGFLVPPLVQSLLVQPSELVQERPFIARTIAFTRQAFGLEAIETNPFNPQSNLTAADLAANALTVRNIRLWDQRPLLETNRQLQQIRPYYRFPDADIDRYLLPTDAAIQPSKPLSQGSTPPNSSALSAQLEQRQVLIAARELDYRAVPKEAQTWVNRHLIYTHGYGFTLNPVNTVDPGGLPKYFVKDISEGKTGALTTASPAIRATIPIGHPRLYYGELTDNYVMTHTLTRELDYPSGSDNVYNIYDGQGGISIGSWWRRGLFAIYCRDWRILFTRDFLPDTKILFRRHIAHRIQAIAPFLQFDSEPYLVAAQASPPDRDIKQGDQNFLYWIIDAYTTSNRYPYSDLGQDGINYIRNSVKVVVDAYHGSVDFYVADPTDPLIATWTKIFPSLFQPLAAMPVELQRHIRYPVDLLKLQSKRLMIYHMTDPQVFYNREDQWEIANEVYGGEPRPVEPYYLITSLPAVPFEEFILLLPYTPRQRPNLIAWLAARSDGSNYGKLLLYTFPKERLVYGPAQIEARINQDPVISQQISLWTRQGSRVIQGNLLIIPIEQSLLYVEPLYLEAAETGLPTLVRVIVAYADRIVMAPTLDEALQSIFPPPAATQIKESLPKR